MENEYKSAQTLLGRLTFTDLSDVEVFMKASEFNAWGNVRAPFSPPLARMSAELSANVYDLNVNPWVKAGWSDCTFIVENRIVPLDRDSDSKLAAIESEWRRRRARSLIRGVRPIGDIVRALRQFLITDMSKTVVMTRILPDGRIVLAISFIGTTQKFFDWFTNFKMRQVSGMHYGFLELARQFDNEAARIMLPAAGTAIGKEGLTLADALAEAASPDSRFIVWLSGHSQGGAVVQTYVRLLLERGVNPERVFAYSFAAPTVAVCGRDIDPGRYPVYNIVNTDDVVPRLGADIRLGIDLFYHPDDVFRHAHYKITAEMQLAFERILFINAQVQTLRDASAWCLAMTRLMEDLQKDQTAEDLFHEMIPHYTMLRKMGLQLESIARYLRGKLEETTIEITGKPPDETICAYFSEMMKNAVSEFGAKAVAQAITKALKAPHSIGPDKKDDSFVPSYLAIVRRYLGEMEMGVWQADTPARCIDAKGELLAPLPTSLPSLIETVLLPKNNNEINSKD